MHRLVNLRIPADYSFRKGPRPLRGVKSRKVTTLMWDHDIWFDHFHVEFAALIFPQKSTHQYHKPPNMSFKLQVEVVEPDVMPLYFSLQISAFHCD